jgi:hypothetical protein
VAAPPTSFDAQFAANFSSVSPTTIRCGLTKTPPAISATAPTARTCEQNTRPDGARALISNVARHWAQIADRIVALCGIIMGGQQRRKMRLVSKPFKDFANFRAWRETQSSIRIQEGPPSKIRDLAGGKNSAEDRFAIRSAVRIQHSPKTRPASAMRRWRRPEDTIGPDQKTGGKSAGLRAWASVVDFQVEHAKKAESSKENQGNDRAQ